jgi:hypothetical protein
LPSDNLEGLLFDRDSGDGAQLFQEGSDIFFMLFSPRRSQWPFLQFLKHSREELAGWERLLVDDISRERGALN